MTVKELIEELQTLDQDKNVWVFYDYPCDAYELEIDGTVSAEEAERFKDYGVKEGDYVTYAG